MDRIAAVGVEEDDEVAREVAETEADYLATVDLMDIEEVISGGQDSGMG